MDSDLPYDTDSTGHRSWPFPTSCSLGSGSLSDDCGESSSGKNYPSTGMIPILLFDDADPSDPTSLSQFGVANHPTSEEAAGSSTGYRVVHDPPGILFGLGIGESSAIRGSSGAQSTTRGGSERNRLNGSHRLLNLAFNPANLDLSSGAANDRKDDGRENDLSPSFDTDSSPSCRSCSCCCSSSSRSSSLSRLSRTGVVRSPSGQSIRQICSGSCGASPAAITNTQLIAAAKEHTQDFALKTLDPRTRKPSSNSIVMCDCMEHLRLPLALNCNHDHSPSNRQRDTHATPSFAEAESSIEFPPRDQTMGRSLPPPYSPIELSSPSSSSSSNLNLPHHLTWLRDTTISLCIDQECFRTVVPTFKLVGYTKPTLPIYSSRAGMQKLLVGGNANNTGGTLIKQLSELMDQASTDPDSAANLNMGMAEFMPIKRESFVFHHSTLDAPPLVRRLSVNGDESRDYLSQHASLSIKSSGGFQVYAVNGSEVRRGSGGGDTVSRSEGGTSSSQIKLEWRFEYTVEDKRKADGTKAGGGEKLLTPLRFSCSPGLLHSRQGRKVTVLNVWKKSIQSSLVAGKVEFPTPISPTSPGHQRHDIAEPSPSPTSPKIVGIGPLRFPTTSRLWGKRAKSSPYRFDKGSDGSEEDLIPSEDPGNRRRRPRPTSAYVSRLSHEAERQLPRWGGDRNKSTDAFRPAARDAWYAIGDAERPRGRNKTQDIGRGAMSEGENERLSPRSQGGYSIPQFGYSRRPRTAR